MSERSRHEHSIRFITSDYDELFRIPDGGTILVTFPDRQFAEKCSYIDEYHTTIGNSVYHICQYAEILEQNGGRCEPEPETLLDKAAWELGHRDYLLVERAEYGFRYELVTKEFLSRAHGQLERKDLTMNQAREYILDTFGMGNRSRAAVSVDYVRGRMQEVLKASDVTNIEWQDSRYFPGMRTAEHDLTCEIRGEKVSLLYEVSRHDDGEGFTIHSDGDDIWDRMPEPELRRLEPMLENAVEFGHWKRDLEQAKTAAEVREVRYGIYETEKMSLSREQILELHEAIDQKEAALLAAEKSSEKAKGSALKELNQKKTAVRSRTASGKHKAEKKGAERT